jgi:hypothetical protein
MHLTNFIGKPYAGKPHVRIDEGAEVKINPHLALLYWLINLFSGGSISGSGFIMTERIITFIYFMFR